MKVTAPLGTPNAASILYHGGPAAHTDHDVNVVVNAHTALSQLMMNKKAEA